MSSNSMKNRVLAAFAAMAAVQSASMAQTEVAQPGALQPVEATSLYKDAFATGVLTPATGALPNTLWRGAEASVLESLLDAAPARPVSASLGAAMRRLYLSPGDTPQGAAPSLGGRKLLALASAGFTEEARNLASLSNAPQSDPHVGQSLAVADLLDGDKDAACGRSSRLSRGKDAPFWVKLRIFCAAVAKQYDSADLTLGILREQGLLNENENALLTALSAPSPLKLPVAPEEALQLAVLREIGAVIAPSALEVGNGGVLKSIALDKSVDARTRLAATAKAASMGVLDAGVLRAIYGSFIFEPGALTAAAAGEANDPLRDAAVYQTIAQMAAPEFLRDKASAIANTLNAAPTHSRAFAASLLYADDIKDLEGVVVAPSEAGAFALARMAVGDPDGAQRWLMSMLGQGVSTLDEETALSFIELTNLLGVLSPSLGGNVAAAANVALSPPRGLSEAYSRAAPVEDRYALAELVDAAFDAATRDVAGQAGLAALALTGDDYQGDPVADAVADRALEVAGLGAVVRQRAFERAWAASFPEASAPTGAVGAVNDGAPPTSPDDGLTPSLKPTR